MLLLWSIADNFITKEIAEERVDKGGLISTLKNKDKKKRLLTLLLAIVSSSVMVGS